MLVERKNCPICKSENIIEKKNDFKDEEIINFLENYYKKKLPQIIYKEYNYKIIMCSECTLIFQKFICDDELSHKLYEDLIDKEKSFNKKKNLYFDDFQ